MLHNAQLHDLYSSQNIILAIKNPLRMRWAGNVPRMV